MDYTKVCWYCGGETMTPKDSYYQCSSCGATWNEDHSLSRPDMTRGSVSWIDDHGKHHRTPAGRPTKTAIQKAAKARVLKEAKP